MINLTFEKLYKDARINEHVYVAVPVKKGLIDDTDRVFIYQNGRKLKTQIKVTSRHDDGSVRFLFVRFLADIDGNKNTDLKMTLTGEDADNVTENNDSYNVSVEKTMSGLSIHTGELDLFINNNSDHLFEKIIAIGKTYSGNQFEGPFLNANGNEYSVKTSEFEVVERGPLCAVVKACGTNICNNGESDNIDFEIKITAYAGKPYFEISYRIINTSYGELAIDSLVFKYNRIDDLKKTEGVVNNESGLVYIDKYNFKDEYNELIGDVRTIAANSNYRTNFSIGKDGENVEKLINAEFLVNESNEHMPETFYGTFFADVTDGDGGLCATVYQAQQNFPKAISASYTGITIGLVPLCDSKVVMQSGMSREQSFMLHFHEKTMSIEDIDNRSIIYQMPDVAVLDSSVYKESEIFPDIFPEIRSQKVERGLVGRCDEHSRIYGMLNFGDSVDMGYTSQGRGKGEYVFANNEYDFPHACLLQHIRTGVRRFRDYMMVAARHQMDVDICHFSDDPLRIGGQIEHTNGHTKNGSIVCSHQWVEGLLDYYHFTGDERGLESAVGIGNNILALLDSEKYQQKGELNARETGWALRTLTALYVETNDKKWLTKMDGIVEDFKIWKQKYGAFMAPYTDNTLVRIGFMISVAIGSLMRYYRVFGGEDIKNLILESVDDLIENTYDELTGIFLYKELPSLKRTANNPLLLESLAIAYELTGDEKYMPYGRQVFLNGLVPLSGPVSKKTIVGDAVLAGTTSSKNFGQGLIPIATYYSALSRCKGEYNLDTVWN